MSRIGFLHALLVVTFSLCLAWSAEARKRSSSYQGNGFSVRFGEDYGRNTRAEAQRTRPEVRRTRLEGRGTRAEDRSTRTAEPTKVTDADPGRGALNAAIDRLVRACLQQAAEFQNWPFEVIARVAQPDDAQRGELETLRSAAATAATRLSGECPQDVSAVPWERLVAAEQAIDAADAAFAAVAPTLQHFYAGLDDEQKARLLRNMVLAEAQAQVEREPEQLQNRGAQRGNERPDRAAKVNHWAGICEYLTAALRTWPIRSKVCDCRRPNG